MSALGERTDVAFDSGGEQCRGWLFRPDAKTAIPAGESPDAASDAVSAGTVPCVVMAHGLGATKEGKLADFAARFVEAGAAALVFDYRHFGDSDGVPRELIDIKLQHEDWQAAIAHARTLDGIDPNRIALWGSSFSGGHVIWTAARDPRIAAVVAQIPHTSGPAGVLATGPKRIAYFAYAALRDQIGRLFGREPFYIPVIGPPGSMATLTTDGAEKLYRDMYPAGWEIPNRAAGRLGLWLGAYSPLRDAAKVRCPLQVVIGETDTITPPAPARKVVDRAPRAELVTYEGGHFDAYFGETFEQISAAEAEFLAHNLGLPTA